MKKTYISPTLQIVKINCEKLIAESYGIYGQSVSNENGGWVKGESSPSSTSRYNVWDDDWSAE